MTYKYVCHAKKITIFFISIIINVWLQSNTYVNKRQKAGKVKYCVTKVPG